MLEKIKTKNLTFAGLWVLFTAALALWAEFLCREDSLSHDTFYQMNLIKHPWNELLYYISIDYSPPLYAFVLKIYASVFGYAKGEVPQMGIKAFPADPWLVRQAADACRKAAPACSNT